MLEQSESETPGEVFARLFAKSASAIPAGTYDFPVTFIDKDKIEFKDGDGKVYVSLTAVESAKFDGGSKEFVLVNMKKGDDDDGTKFATAADALKHFLENKENEKLQLQVMTDESSKPSPPPTSYESSSLVDFMLLPETLRSSAGQLMAYESANFQWSNQYHGPMGLKKNAFRVLKRALGARFLMKIDELDSILERDNFRFAG